MANMDEATFSPISVLTIIKLSPHGFLSEFTDQYSRTSLKWERSNSQFLAGGFFNMVWIFSTVKYEGESQP